MTKLEKAVTIDEALEKIGFGRFNYCVILFTGLLLHNVILESIGISFVLPVLQCDLNITSQQQGILGAVNFIGIIATSHLWGYLADTTGRKRIMHPALLLGFAVTICSSFSTNFETLAVMRFLSGVLLSAGSATVFAYLGEFHCHLNRNRALMTAALINAICTIFLPLLAWVLINQNWAFHVPYLNITYKPWRSFVLACGLPGFICALLLFYLPESPKYLLTSGQQDKALAALKQIVKLNRKRNSAGELENYHFDTLIADEDTPIKCASTDNNQNAFCTLLLSMWHQTAPLFQKQHLKKTILASLIQFITFFTAHGVYMWFPYILNKTMQYTQHSSDPVCLCDILQYSPSHNISAEENEMETVCVDRLEISTYQHTISLEVIYVILLLSITFVVGKFGRRKILFTTLLVCGSCGILALAVKIPLLAVYLFVIYLCSGLGTTLVNATVVDIYPTHLRAMAMCISLMVGRFGSVAGSNVLGALIDSHCSATLYISGSTLIIAGILTLFLPKPENPKTKEVENC